MLQLLNDMPWICNGRMQLREWVKIIKFLNENIKGPKNH